MVFPGDVSSDSSSDSTEISPEVIAKANAKNNVLNESLGFVDKDESDPAMEDNEEDEVVETRPHEDRKNVASMRSFLARARKCSQTKWSQCSQSLDGLFLLTLSAAVNLDVFFF